MTEKRKDTCNICGKELMYAMQIEDRKDLKCYFCNKTFSANTFCPNDHYICDTCHSETPIKIISEFSKKTILKDPYEIANQIMKHPMKKRCRFK